MPLGFQPGGVLVRGHVLARRTGVGIASLGLIGAAVSAAGPPAQAAVTAGADRPARPSVSKVAPASGTTAGGTRVTVTGRNFTRVRAVDFGSARGSQLKVASGRKLTVVVPKHPAGLARVKVITAAGSSASVAADHYTYVAPPGRVTGAGVLAATPHTLMASWRSWTRGCRPCGGCVPLSRGAMSCAS